MDNIEQKDKEFLDAFFNEELTEKRLIELEKRLQNPAFKAHYNKKLDEKYKISPIHLFISYLPMIILIGLAILGIYLILR